MTTPRTVETRTLGVRTLSAYLERNGRTFAHYACLTTGSRTAAKAIMRGFSAELGLHWEYVLRQAGYDAFAWRLLRKHVNVWLEEHDSRPHAAEDTARAHAEAVGQLGEIRRNFATEESTLGLYQALGRLPERQFDVMALRFLLHQEVEDIAGYMGIGIGTVYSTINQARDALMRSASVRSLLRPECRPAPAAAPRTPGTENPEASDRS